MLRLMGSLRGLRVQLLLWLVLPLTLALVLVAVAGISIHQRAMRQMVEELDGRSAQLAATHLGDGLTERVVLLQIIAASGAIPPDSLSEPFFDGGLARFNGSGQVTEATPSVEAWQARPISLLNLEPKPEIPPQIDQDQPQILFSPLFVDPILGRESLLLSLALANDEWIVGTVSLEQLGLAEIVAQAKTPGLSGLNKSYTRIGMTDRAPPTSEVTALLVDTEGRVIYHSDSTLIEQDLRKHKGVIEVIQGRAGATYHQEPDGRELAVGYAPVAGPGWGLLVQEPWEALIAPSMRFSLLAPLTLVVAALVSGLAVTFGLRYVIHPLQTLDKQATRLAWGDFAAVNKSVGGVQEIEDLRRTLAGMADQIRRYQSGMRDYMAAVTMAQEDERKRLARELHDETVQSLIALGHRVEMVQKALDKDPDKARQRLAELRALATDTQEEVRRFSQALRPLYLEDLGLIPAVEMLAQEVERQSGLSIAIRIEGEACRLASDLELTAYRIVQEGLSNVFRHAQAQNIWLTINFTPEGLKLRLSDDGQGFDPPVNPAELAPQGHFGLMGIHERALLFGGRLEIHSKPGEGTTVEVFLQSVPNFSRHDED